MPKQKSQRRFSSRSHKRKQRKTAEAGFTLLELLVVLGILALLASVAGPQVIGYLGKAKSDTARMQVNNIVNALELHFLDTGQYPAADQGLRSLVEPPAEVPRWNGPYLKTIEGLTDPWGNPYQYRMPGEHGRFDVYTLGRDKTEGGAGEDKDVMNW